MMMPLLSFAGFSVTERVRCFWLGERTSESRWRRWGVTRLGESGGRDRSMSSRYERRAGPWLAKQRYQIVRPRTLLSPLREMWRR